MEVKFISTTNPQFKYLEGVIASQFYIDVVVNFNDFHTSRISRIDYNWTSNYHAVLTVETKNSTYVFDITL